MGFPIHCQGENIAGTLQLNLQWWGCVWGVVVDSKQNFFSRLKPLQNVVLNDGSLVRYPTPWKTFREVGTWDVHKPLLVGYTIELRCYEIPWVSIKIHRFTNKKKRKRATGIHPMVLFWWIPNISPWTKPCRPGAFVKTPYGNSFLSNQYLQHVFDEL